jgi:hypothetical protein
MPAQSVTALTTIQLVQLSSPRGSLHNTELEIFTNLKMAVFQDTVPFSLVETNRRFRVASFPNHQGDDLMMEVVSTSEMSVSLFQTTWHSIPEQSSSYLPKSEPKISINQSIQNSLTEMYWTILWVNYIIGRKACEDGCLLGCSTV